MKINYSTFIYDDSRSKAFGVGGEISYKIAYKLHESKRIKLYPYFQIAYSPYLYSPMTEAVINQTKNLVAKNWGTNYSFQIGCRFQFQKAVN